MSGTRIAQPGGPLRQNRFASSPEFERGLLANLVAKRCSMLDSAAERELIWFLQHRSHRDGLKAVAAELLAKGVLGTDAMVEVGKVAGESYNAAEVLKIRGQMPSSLRPEFPLPGECERVLEAMSDSEGDTMYRWFELGLAESETANSGSKTEHPSRYPVDLFLDLCRKAALEADGRIGHLEGVLSRLCLDPAFDLEADPPWYFRQLIGAAKQSMERWIVRSAEGLAATSVSRSVHESLDYALASRCLVMVNGEPRRGKSFAAKKWCEARPGRARYAEVPTGSDDGGFFRAVARALGVSTSLNYKAVQIRHHIEDVLLSGDLMLCLDEAHRLFPQKDVRYAVPVRINWLMSMVNQGLPVCLITTPQFFATQRVVEKHTHWTSAQFVGRIGHYEELPKELSREELMAVAKAMLPEADNVTLRALAGYARSSARYLAAIEAIANRARYIAGRDARETTTDDDVHLAMKQSVVPADSNLVKVFRSVEDQAIRKGKRKAVVNLPAPEPPRGLSSRGHHPLVSFPDGSQDPENVLEIK